MDTMSTETTTRPHDADGGPTMRPKRPTAQDLLVQRIEELRTAKRLTRASLAKGIGKSEAQISLLLKGKRGISLDVLDDLASFFGVPIASFFESPLDPERSTTSREREIVDALRAADPKTVRAVETLLDVHEEPIIERPSPSSLSPEDANHVLADIINAVISARHERPGAHRPPAGADAAAVRKRAGHRS